MAGERRVVGLQVKLEGAEQVVLAQEIQAGSGVGIVLVLRRLLGLGLDVELALKADGLLVIGSQVQELAEVVHLALEIGVEERAVAFASAPENIARALERVRHLNGLLNLRGGVSEDVGIAARGRAVRETRMHKQASRAPKQLHPRALLLLLEHLHDGVQVPVGLAEAFAFWRYVAVVEGRSEEHTS